MELKIDILESLVLSLKARKSKAKVCLDNYLYNSAGIGEHPDIVAESIKLLEEIAQADSELNTLYKLYPDELQR